jgi:hypothetical protein
MFDNTYLFDQNNQKFEKFLKSVKTSIYDVIYILI